MSIFDSAKMCTFSRISGVILQDGQPVAGALVVRETDYERKARDQTHTDKNGRFELDAQFEQSVAKFLPQEFVVGQTILFTANGKEYKIWSGVKRSPEENSESRGKPLVVSCDLNSEKTIITVDNQPFITLCQWDVEPDVTDTGF